MTPTQELAFGGAAFIAVFGALVFVAITRGARKLAKKTTSKPHRISPVGTDYVAQAPSVRDRLDRW
jgi:hypothetical protein